MRASGGFLSGAEEFLTPTSANTGSRLQNGYNAMSSTLDAKS